MSVVGRESFRMGRHGRTPSLTGMAVVFLRQMRARNAWRDLAWSGVLLGGWLAIAGVLQGTWAQANLYSGDAPGFLMRWLTTGTVATVFLFLPCAAILGAFAVPPSTEFEATQSVLLTRLTAFDLCVGRLMAALWPLTGTLLASCVFWLIAQLGWHFLVGTLEGFGPIVGVHLVLFSAIWMVAGVGFLGATKLRPGRIWGRGVSMAMLWTALCLLGILLLNPLLQRMDKPVRLIESALLLNPLSAVSNTLNLDILRTEWIYTRTVAPEFPFLYPSVVASFSVFVLIGLGALALSAIRLRRAYR